MSTNEIFKKRPGCTDLGKDYEHLYICTLILKLITDKAVKNFHLSSNDNDFGAFDDVVVEIEYSNTSKEKYAIQMKHSNREKSLTKRGLTDKNGNFSIKKYFEEFTKLKLLYSYKFVLFTNLKFEIRDDEVITLPDNDFSISIKLSQEEGLFSTSEKGRCYKLKNSDTKYQMFFENFFLYTDQAGVGQLKTDTMTKFRETFKCEESIFEQYFQFVTQWSLIEGAKTKLSRDFMISAIVIRLLTPHMMPLIFTNEEVSTNTVFFREAMSKLKVTCFESTRRENVRRIWRDVKKTVDIKNLNSVNRKFKVTSYFITHLNDIDDRDCTKLLWLMGLCPLPIFANETFYEVVSLCQGNFILFGESRSAVFPKFQHLSDLDPEFYESIIREFKCSLQGTNDLSLKSLFKRNQKIREIVTTNELVQMLDESFKIGGKKEILPIPHIDRVLTRNIISMEFFGKISSHTLVVICNVKDENLQKIRNSSITSVNLTRVDDFWKRQNFSENETEILFTAKDCSKEEVESIFKTSQKKKYYQFRIFEGELEWVRSCGDTLQLKEFRIGRKTIDQSELFSTPCDNQINLVCADPGMGKSILMKNLKNSSKVWTILIQPKDHAKYFRGKNSKAENFVKYIIDKNYRNCDGFLREFLEILVGDLQIMFIWDGLDEAAKENLAMILEIIDELGAKGYTQWLTSRCNLLNTLEFKFGVLSRNIEQFDSDQQNSYIETRLNCSRSDLDDIKNKIHSCIRLVQYNDILGIPLQICMFTELFCQNPEKYRSLLSNIFSITDLYRHFVDEKFNIYHKVKANLDDSNDMIMQIMEQSKKERLQHYEEVALKTFLDPEILEALKINCESFLELVQTDCDSVGVIVDVTDDKIPSFLHNSYGEYFAASFLCKNYRKVPKFVDFIFEERYNNIRFLFDLLMAEDCPAHIAVLYKNIQVLEEHQDDIGMRDKGGRNPLHVACSWGKRFDLDNSQKIDTELEAAKVDTPVYRQIVSLLSERCDPFETDGLFKMNCFYYGAYSCSLLPILILSNRHKIDFKSLKNFNDIDTILYNAVKFDYSDVFEEIPYLTIDDQRSLLHLSVIHESVKCLRKILKNPVYKKTVSDRDRNGVTPFHLACRSGNLDIIKYLIDAGVDMTATTSSGGSGIYVAARSGHPQAIQLLVNLGLDINFRNKKGETAFFLASKSKNSTVAQMLIDLGADINIGDNFGYTPLYLSCRHQAKEMIKLLLNNGVNVNIPNIHGDLPFFMAAWSNQLDVALWLLEAGADIDAANKKGHGAIHAACLNSLTEVLQFLIERGVDLNKANRYGQTPLHLAVRQHFEEGIVLLLQAGADDGLRNLYGEVFWEMGRRYFKMHDFVKTLERGRGEEYVSKFKSSYEVTCGRELNLREVERKERKCWKCWKCEIL